MILIDASLNTNGLCRSSRDLVCGLVFEYIYNLSAPRNTSAVYIYLRFVFTAVGAPTARASVFTAVGATLDLVCGFYTLESIIPRYLMI
jgi:hypothetical protein